MTWAAIDDNAPDHRKLVEAGPIASWLWVCGLCYCNRQPARDGFIPTGKVPALYKLPSPMKHATILVRVGLWRRVKGGFRVHDYHVYQPDAAKVAERRKLISEARARAGRVGGLRSGEVRHQTKQTKQTASNCFKQTGPVACEANAANSQQNEAPSPPLPYGDLNTDGLVPTPARRRGRAAAASAVSP